MGQSLLKLAIERGLVDVRLHNIRDWANDKHRTVDDRPFGGGPGMMLKVEPVVECVEAVRAEDAEPGHLVMLTPQGRRLTQAIVEELAGHKRLLLLCGRYEGFDDRVRQILSPTKFDRRLCARRRRSGGDGRDRRGGPAGAGRAGRRAEPGDDSFSGEDRLLEFAQYTRPREYRGLGIPEVLLSGNHEQIARWRKEQSLHATSSGEPTCYPGLKPSRPASNIQGFTNAQVSRRGLTHFGHRRPELHERLRRNMCLTPLNHRPQRNEKGPKR